MQILTISTDTPDEHYNDNRDAYYGALRNADASDDYTVWLTYFLGGFAYQMFRIQERARKGAQG